MVVWGDLIWPDVDWIPSSLPFAPRCSIRSVFITPSVNKQFLLRQQHQPYRQMGRAHMVSRGRMLCQEARKDPLSVMSTPPTPARHEKFIRMTCVHVRLSQFLSNSQQRECLSGSPFLSSVWTDRHADARHATKAGEWRRWGPWLARLAGRVMPQQKRRDPGNPRGWSLLLLLWRWSQAMQLLFIQAFPVLEIVVQMLHKIGQVGKSWRQDGTVARLSVRFWSGTLFFDAPICIFYIPNDTSWH